jgi:hypothetical protein
MFHQNDLGPSSDDVDVRSTILTCPHEYITASGVCAGCGTTCAAWNTKGKVFYKSKPAHLSSKTNTRSILPDLNAYNFPENIKYKADAIFDQLGAPTKRGNERKKMLFYLVYRAYQENDQVINPYNLGAEMGLQRTDVCKASNLFQDNKGYRPRNKRALPTDALPDLCKELDLEHLTESVLELGNEILEKEPRLVDELPHKVAAGILVYFMEIHGIKISPELLKDKITFSEVTIKEIHQRVSKIHNQV